MLFVLVSIFADVVAPDPDLRQDVTRRLQGSSAEHLLGTDHIGRDFLSRNIYGARLSLLVGFAATTVAVLVATVVGGLSGFIGGRLWAHGPAYRIDCGIGSFTGSARSATACSPLSQSPVTLPGRTGGRLKKRR